MQGNRLLGPFIIGSGSPVSWCEAKRWHPRKYVIGRILALLQLRVEMKLALSTIKGQILALAVFFSKTAYFTFFDSGLYTRANSYNSASLAAIVPMGFKYSFIGLAKTTL